MVLGFEGDSCKELFVIFRETCCEILGRLLKDCREVVAIMGGSLLQALAGEGAILLYGVWGDVARCWEDECKLHVKWL